MISSKYKDLYLSTIRDQLKKMSALLVSLEKKPQSTNLLENIFRVIHSMKGAAATMSYQRTVRFLHIMESVIDRAYRQVMDLDKPAIDALFSAQAALNKNIESIKKSSQEIYFNGPTKILSGVLKKTNPVQATKSAVSDRPHILGSLPPALELTVSTDSLDNLQNKLDELFINSMELKSLVKNLGDTRLLSLSLETERLLGALRRELETIRVVPLADILSALPYMVREIAKNENKEAELVIRDNNLSLDRAILDELIEILIQLLRNSIAHGIKAGQKKGKIEVAVNLENDSVRVTVSDNGQGIDWQKILALAVKNKVIKAGEAKKLNVEQIKNLIFMSGVSGGAHASTSSGRGIGLSLVKDKVISLGGDIRVESQLGKGASFIVHFPLPLSIFRSLSFRLGQFVLSLPLSHIYKIIKLPEVKALPKTKNYIYKKSPYQLVFLEKTMSLPDWKPLAKYIILLKANEQKIALPIYSNIKEEEVVMKKTPPVLKKIKYIKGAAVSSSGQVNIILDINNLI